VRLLVLGGTSYLSWMVGRVAVERRHEVTVAARGRSGQPPSGTRLVRVDRDRPEALVALGGERFDAVVDVSSHPGAVQRALVNLAHRAEQWIYVSSGKVYADLRATGQRADHAAVVAAADPGEWGEVHASSLGPRKVACEQLVRGAARRWLIARPGLVVGPRDPADRFGYWPHRLARGGDVLAPGSPEDPVQFIDLRDLADWLVSAAERGLSGTFDAISAPLPRGELLRAVARGVGAADITVHWVDEEFLLAHQVRPWQGPHSLPLWMPRGRYPGFFTFDPGPAVSAGLRSRDPALTARDIYAWQRSAGPGHRLAGGLTAGDEADLLAAWWRRSAGDHPPEA
jgi:nucleoside-diphosphate-sugar epimerase